MVGAPCGKCGSTRKYRSNGACVECQKKRAEAWQKSHLDRVREHRRKTKLKRKYKLTPEQYDSMLAAQGGHCAICPCTPRKNGKRLAVDHDHRTGRIRGLLCSDHNRALGLLGDSSQLCLRAAAYLQRPAR